MACQPDTPLHGLCLGHTSGRSASLQSRWAAQHYQPLECLHRLCVHVCVPRPCLLCLIPRLSVSASMGRRCRAANRGIAHGPALLHEGVAFPLMCPGSRPGGSQLAPWKCRPNLVWGTSTTVESRILLFTASACSKRRAAADTSQQSLMAPCAVIVSSRPPCVVRHVR